MSHTDILSGGSVCAVCWGGAEKLYVFCVFPENGYASTDEEPSEFSQASDSR